MTFQLLPPPGRLPRPHKQLSPSQPKSYAVILFTCLQRAAMGSFSPPPTACPAVGRASMKACVLDEWAGLEVLPGDYLSA